MLFIVRLVTFSHNITMQNLSEEFVRFYGLNMMDKDHKI